MSLAMTFQMEKVNFTVQMEMLSRVFGKEDIFNKLIELEYSIDEINK